MENQNRSRMMTEGAMMVGLAAVLGYLGQMLLTPVLFLYPLPFLVLGYRHGTKATVIAILASLGVCSLLFMPIAALSMTMSLGLPAIAMVWGIHHSRSFGEIIIIGGLAALLGFGGAAVLFQLVSGIDMVEYVTALTGEMQSVVETTVAANSTLDAEQAELMLTQFTAMIEMVKRTLPASLLITSMLIAYVNMRLMVMVLKRIKMAVPDMPQFKLFVLPRGMAFGILAMYLAGIFLEYRNFFEPGILTQNILILAMAAFLVQGWAVVIYILGQRTKSKTVIVLIIVMSLLFAAVQYAVLILGMLDRFFNFRRLPSTGV
jgi:uncharacterized protein YybS (DUF2232 family)